MWVFLSSVVDHWLTLCFVSSFAIPAYREWPRLIKHKLEVCLQWRGTMAKRLCENPNAIMRKCILPSSLCWKWFPNISKLIMNVVPFILSTDVRYMYVRHASDRAWYEIHAKPVKYPTGSNQTEPRTSRYQQLATSANLTQAPKHSLNYWCASFLVQWFSAWKPATWTIIDTCWLPGSPALWYSSSRCHCYALPALWCFHAALPGGLEPLERTCESFPGLFRISVGIWQFRQKRLEHDSQVDKDVYIYIWVTYIYIYMPIHIYIGDCVFLTCLITSG